MPRLTIGTVYRVLDATALPGMTSGMPILLNAVIPAPRGLEAVLSILINGQRREYRLPLAQAEAVLVALPDLPEVAAAKHCGFGDWAALLTALQSGQRFTIPVPPNGDPSIESFTHWFELLEQHHLCMIHAPNGRQATLGLVTSFERAELDAAAERVARFAEPLQREFPPWVKDGQVDFDYLASKG